MNIKKKFIESINIKHEYNGEILDVELDTDIDLSDGKKHTIKSKDIILNIIKKGTTLDIEIGAKNNLEEKDDVNIEIYNKKLSFDIKRARLAGIPENIPEVLFEALSELSERRIGALIAIENNINLNKYCENGEKINCPISNEIFMSIFYPGTKVHDGATIIKNGIIKYSSVFFKNISNDIFTEHYGARHRAAMKLSKETDAFCIIVSEESGNISFAIDGKLYVIKANDVKKSKNRFIKLFNGNKNEGRD